MSDQLETAVTRGLRIRSAQRVVAFAAGQPIDDDEIDDLVYSCDMRDAAAGLQGAERLAFGAVSKLVGVIGGGGLADLDADGWARMRLANSPVVADLGRAAAAFLEESTGSSGFGVALIDEHVLPAQAAAVLVAALDRFRDPRAIADSVRWGEVSSVDRAELIGSASVARTMRPGRRRVEWRNPQASAHASIVRIALHAEPFELVGVGEQLAIAQGRMGGSGRGRIVGAVWPATFGEINRRLELSDQDPLTDRLIAG